MGQALGNSCLLQNTAHLLTQFSVFDPWECKKFCPSQYHARSIPSSHGEHRQVFERHLQKHPTWVFLGAAQVRLMLQIPQWLHRTDHPETHKMCLNSELARCWGYLSCFLSCNIYHHAEVFGLLYMRLQMLKGQVRAQLTFLLVSLRLSREQSSLRAAEVSQQAAATQRHVCSGPCCSGKSEAGIQSLALTDSTEKVLPSGSQFSLLWEGREWWCWIWYFVHSAHILQGQRTCIRSWPAPFLMSPANCAICYKGLAAQTMPRPLSAFHVQASMHLN